MCLVACVCECDLVGVVSVCMCVQMCEGVSINLHVWVCLYVLVCDVHVLCVSVTQNKKIKFKDSYNWGKFSTKTKKKY